MASSIEDILALINSGGDSKIELADMANQTAIARALKQRQVSPVMSSGRATLPNISGIVSNGMDARQGTADESRLMSERLQVQQAETNRAGTAIQPSIKDLSGVQTIDDVDGGAGTPLAGSSPAAVEEFNLLQAATRGAPAVEGQDTLRKYALARAVEKSRRQGGGTSADQQWINSYMETNPNADWNKASDALRKWKETFGVTKVAGVENIVGNRGTGAAPLTTIATVADNERDTAAATATGAVEGKTEADRAYAAPIERVMVDGMKAQATAAIGKMQQIKSDPALSRITGFNSLFPNFPGQSAADVQGRLDSLKSMLGFDKLQEIRAQNKTGGGVGALSDPEREALERSIVALAQSQSDEQLRENMDFLMKQYNGMIQRLEAKYQAEYGNLAHRALPRATNRPTEAPAPAAAPAVNQKDPLDLGI